MNTIKVITKSGTWLNYEAIVPFMDDEIREELHMKLAPCTEQKFFNAYEKAHYKRYGRWFLSMPNPQY